MFRKIVVINNSLLQCLDNEYVVLGKIHSVRVMHLPSEAFAVQVYTDGRALHGVTAFKSDSMPEINFFIRELAQAMRFD